MGTSTSNLGPSNNTPLLPSWAQPNSSSSDQSQSTKDPESEVELNGEVENQTIHGNGLNISLSGVWKPAKDSLSSYIKNPSKDEFNSAAKAYVRASGGVKGISSSVITGKSVGARFGDLFSSFSRNGVDSTFRQYFNVDIAGLPLESAINKIVEYLCPRGGTVEDSIVADAVSETLIDIYKEFELNNNDLSILDNISNENIKEILTNYASSYVYTKWMREIGIVFENKEISENQITRIERQMKEFIKESVKLEFSEIDFINESTFGKAEITNIMDEIFETAYQSLEDL